MRRLTGFVLTMALLVPAAAMAGEADRTKTLGLEGTSELALTVARDGATTTVRGFRAGPYEGTHEQVARAFLADFGSLVGLDPEDATTLRHQRNESWRGRTMVHLQQQHAGVPVSGGSVMVKLDRASRPTLVTSTLRSGLTVDMTPAVDAGTVRATAEAAVGGLLQGSQEPQLTVVPTAGGGQLVYRVHVFTDAPPAAWQVTVDALSGAVRSVDDLRRQAQGTAYESNPVNGDASTVDIEHLNGDGSVLDGTYAVAASVVFDGGGEMGLEHLAIADTNGDFFYEPEEHSYTDPFSEVMAYYHTTQVSQYFEEVHGHSFGSAATIYSNYREEDGGSYDNAYYTEDQFGNTIMAFGQGSIDFGYDADAICHEFGHSIVEDRALLMGDWAPWDEYGIIFAKDAIHEGFADYWSATFMGDPIMGEYSLDWPAYGMSPRDLTNTKTCPDDLEFEGHADGEILGAAAWSVREAIGATLADEVMYAMLGNLPDGVSFASLAEVIAELVGDLADDGELTQEDLDAVTRALTDKGLYDCGRSMEVPLEETTEVPVELMWGSGALDDEQCEQFRERGFRLPLMFQQSFTFPDDQGPLEALDITFPMERQDGESTGENDFLYYVMFRKDELVKFDMETVEMGSGYEMDVPVPGDQDILLEELETSLHLTLADDQGLALEAGSTYYMTVLHQNCASADMFLTIEPAYGEFEGDDDDSADDDDDDGCNCRVAGDRTPALGGVALLVLMGVVLRRRMR